MPYRVKMISDIQGMKDFLELPVKIYKNDSIWVAPQVSEIQRILNANSNPYFRNASLKKFICYKGEEPVARSIFVINHEHWKKFGKKTAFFGFFESINDEEASGYLFEEAGKYCRSEGAEFLEGPFNPNHYSEMGILINNFNSPQIFFETYNPEYYLKLLEMSGFHVMCNLHTRINRNTGDYVRHRYDLSSRQKCRDFSVRHFNLFKIKAELERIREVNNDAFSNNWYFLPLTSEEYLFSAKFMFFVTYPKLNIIVEHHGEPVGVLQCVLNINNLLQPMKGKFNMFDLLGFLRKRPWINEIIIYAIGVKRAYQKTVVFKLLFESVCKIVQRYPIVSTTWMTEDNVSAIRASELLGLEPYKRFAIYEKVL